MLRSQGGYLTVLWYLIQLKCPERELEKLAEHLLAEFQYLRSAGRLTVKNRFVLHCPSRCLSLSSVYEQSKNIGANEAKSN